MDTNLNSDLQTKSFDGMEFKMMSSLDTMKSNNEDVPSHTIPKNREELKFGSFEDNSGNSFKEKPITKSNTTKNNDLSTLQSEINSLEPKVKNLKEMFEDIIQSISSTNASTSLDNRFKAKSNESEIENLRKTYEQEILNLRETVSSLTKSNKELTDSLEEYKLSTNDSNKNLTETKFQLSNLVKEFTDEKSKLQSKDKIIEKLNIELQSKDKTIEQLKIELQSKNKAIEESKQKYDNTLKSEESCIKEVPKAFIEESEPVKEEEELHFNSFENKEDNLNKIGNELNSIVLSGPFNGKPFSNMLNEPKELLRELKENPDNSDKVNDFIESIKLLQNKINKLSDAFLLGDSESEVSLDKVDMILKECNKLR